jgi:hypothetical protein
MKLDEIRNLFESQCCISAQDLMRDATEISAGKGGHIKRQANNCFLLQSNLSGHSETITAQPEQVRSLTDSPHARSGVQSGSLECTLRNSNLYLICRLVACPFSTCSCGPVRSLPPTSSGSSRTHTKPVTCCTLVNRILQGVTRRSYRGGEVLPGKDRRWKLACLQVLSTRAQQQHEWATRPTCAHEDSSLLCDLQASFSEAIRSSNKCRCRQQAQSQQHCCCCNCACEVHRRLPIASVQQVWQKSSSRSLPEAARLCHSTAFSPPHGRIFAPRQMLAQGSSAVYKSPLPPRPPATQGMYAATPRAHYRGTDRNPDADMARQLRKLFFKEVMRKQRRSVTLGA